MVFLGDRWLCELLNFGVWRHILVKRNKVEDLQHEFLALSVSLKLLDADIVALLVVDTGTILDDVEFGAGQVDDCLDRRASVLDV